MASAVSSGMRIRFGILWCEVVRKTRECSPRVLAISRNTGAITIRLGERSSASTTWQGSATRGRVSSSGSAAGVDQAERLIEEQRTRSPVLSGPSCIAAGEAAALRGELDRRLFRRLRWGEPAPRRRD